MLLDEVDKAICFLPKLLDLFDGWLFRLFISLFLFILLRIFALFRILILLCVLCWFCCLCSGYWARTISLYDDFLGLIFLWLFSGFLFVLLLLGLCFFLFFFVLRFFCLGTGLSFVVLELSAGCNIFFEFVSIELALELLISIALSLRYYLLQVKPAN